MFKQKCVLLSIVVLAFVVAGCGKSTPTSASSVSVSNESSESSIPAEVQEFTNEMSKISVSAVSNTPTSYSVKYVVDCAAASTTATSIYYVEGNSWKYERIYTNHWEKEVVLTIPDFFLYAAGSGFTYRSLTVYNNGVQDSLGSGNGSFQYLRGKLQ